ncbi:response regulator transcription factor, partial [Vibrio alginolyticus]|nr:response regulator transcription factor [Vibrio alginolyticus]
IDLIILDSIVEGHDGIRIASNILATGYHGRLLFISSQDYTSLSKTVYEIGGHGFVSKNEKKETIVDAIVSVCKGYSIFKTDHLSSKEGIKLSKREVIVFNYLSKGYSNKRISEQLSLSAKTISTYKARILKKYQADSFIEILNTTQNNRKIKVPY